MKKITIKTLGDQLVKKNQIINMALCKLREIPTGCVLSADEAIEILSKNEE